MSKILDQQLQWKIFANRQGLLKNSLQIILGVLVLAITSQLSIPLNPVPLTFQSTTVILLALLFGSRMSSYMIIAYFLAGIAGLPVFADFSFGISKLFGPTGGYLFGFLPAAFITGYIVEKGFAKKLIPIFMTGLAGTAIIFFCGFTMLSMFVGSQEALRLGVMPFLITELLKLIAASGLFWRFINRSNAN